MTERPISPTDADNRVAWREQHDLETEHAFVGRVQNWNATTQTCDIVPLLRAQVPQADGTYLFEELPVVPSVAVLQPRTRGTFLSLPVADGDTLLCLALDGDHSAWRRGASDDTVAPRDLRRHHIAHAVALAGHYRYDQPIRHGSATDVVLGFDADGGTRLAIKANGSVTITQGASVAVQIDADGTVHLGGAAGQFVALANLVNSRLADIRTAFNSHTHALVAVPVVGPGPVFPPLGTASGATATPTSPLATLASVEATLVKAT